jgi:hypothetical protein
MTEEVRAAVRRSFPESDESAILELLDYYGVEPYERERERIQLAIVALSKGNEDRLLHLIQAAKTDFRDVLCWLETGEPTEEEGREAQRAVYRAIERMKMKPANGKI